MAERPTISKVLVANRGEIARRIVRGCRESGLASTAVFTDVDAASPHRHEATDAVQVPGYLDVESLLAAARATGADAVHPGYGFLSENAGFARAVVDAGLTWIGPSPDVIELMGRKDRARQVAEKVGVPVTPRYDPDAVPADAYPVLVKAAAGGGGKGMHVVREAEQLAEALATAAREAAASFGDDTLLVERYVEGGRHVEVQVFGDTHGTVVHLFTRDCSAQRRHQKIVEEAPAFDLPDAVRELLHTSSVALAQEVGYTSAGTVEFLVNGDECFFLEMNTRLQVEHPVTEEVTGADLVRWQLDVAAGAALPDQDSITCTGHAVEVRVYAEDPYAGFLPQAGRIEAFRPGPGARVEDAGLAAVSTAYDPMVAKLVVRGEDRADALDRMVGVLDATVLAGLANNLGFVRRLLDSAELRAGQVHTGFLDAHEGPLLERPDVPAAAAAVAAGLLWPQVGDGWRSAGAPARVRRPVVDGSGVQHDVVSTDSPDLTGLLLGGRAHVVHEGQTWTFERPDGMRRPHAAVAGDADVAAPMPGTVLEVRVTVGEVVEAGQRLGTIEAMKMELALVAAHAGTVTVLGAAVGDQVPMGHVLFHVEPEETHE
ncbi:hypothetical protein ASD11_15370 [Aeromicrobium sp. Root495]|uniref:acetyl/propionyl/methylcrotonyl-CoA carboxylase subunit alpha n=1 Tax=Aeromicrobium sp. Root495 TaxID=1736550 RepID=UPI0006F59705|nr:biotin carboxylase N-terminal domain-containing protein [Aeromicrobium sp. Root495]KQY55874.1 hypothetical protein ASD11_15370 [Aeromicrobium sp. Root495]